MVLSASETKHLKKKGFALPPRVGGLPGTDRCYLAEQVKALKEIKHPACVALVQVFSHRMHL